MTLYQLIIRELYRRYLGRCLKSRDGKPYVCAHIQLDNFGTCMQASFYDRSRHFGYFVKPFLVVNYQSEMPTVVEGPEYSI